jgi:hypothetical protein
MTSRTSDSNPFASRFLRPGTLPFLFDRGKSVETLLDDLGRQAWWGQVVGPHGTGKSTLLATLADALERIGRHPVRFTLHDGQRTLPVGGGARQPWDAQTQVIVDGYEQLSWLSRSRLGATCRLRKAGLLVTAHTDVGLPLLCETTVSDETAWQVVTRLAAPGADKAGQNPVSRAEIAASLQRHGGNLREVLFELYDLHEQRRTS